MKRDMEKFYKKDYIDSYILVFKIPLSHDYYENAKKNILKRKFWKITKTIMILEDSQLMKFLSDIFRPPGKISEWTLTAF